MGRYSFDGRPSRGTDPLLLVFDRYSVVIGPLPDDMKGALAALTTPWYCPTHLLSITVEGGDSAEALDAFVYDIRQFLSFVWGQYVGIALA